MAREDAGSLLSRLSPVGGVPADVQAAAAQSRRIVEDNVGNAIRYVILDCSGTVMDKYVDAPAIVFVEVFRRFGVPITMSEARVPMGLRKDLHRGRGDRRPEASEMPPYRNSGTANRPSLLLRMDPSPRATRRTVTWLRSASWIQTRSPSPTMTCWGFT